MEHNYIIPFDTVNTMVLNHLKITLASICAFAHCNHMYVTNYRHYHFMLAKNFDILFHIIEKDANSSTCVKRAMKQSSYNCGNHKLYEQELHIPH